MTNKVNSHQKKTYLGRIRNLSFAKKLLLLFGINILIDTVSVLTDEDTFHIRPIQGISWQLNIDHRSGIFAPVFLKVHQKSALDHTFEYNVRQMYSRYFDTGKALDEQDYIAIKEDFKKELKTYLETVLYGIDYFENKVDRTTSFPSIKKIEVHGTTSPEASGKGKNSYLPGVINMENLTLGGIRANTGEQILFEVLQELGIETVLSEKTTEEIQCEKTTEEIQYTDEELERLQSLANKFGYKDIDALHEEYNFGSGCVNQPSLRSAMNKIVASKRNLFITVHFAGERDEVIVLPIRNFFLLLPFLRRRRKKGGTQSNEKKTSVQKEDDEKLLGPNPVETATYLFMTYTNLEFSFIGNSDELQKLKTMQYEDIEHLINTLLLPYKIDTAHIKKICAEKKTPKMFFDQKFESIKEKNILKWIALYVYKLQHFPDMYTILEYGLEDEVGEHHTADKHEPHPKEVSTEGHPSTADAAINTIIQSKNSSDFGIHTPSGTTQQQNYVTKNNLATLFQASKKQHIGKKHNLSHSGLVIKQPRQFRKDNHRPYGNRQKGNRKGRYGQGYKQPIH